MGFFSGCEEFAVIPALRKSTLNDYAHWLDAEDMEAMLEVISFDE